MKWSTDQPGSETPELHLRDYWFVLMRHRGVVVATTLVTVFLTGLWTLTQRPVYRAVALIEVRPERFDIGDPLYRPMVPFTIETFMNTQMDIARSQPVARLVLSRIGPDRVAAFLRPDSPLKDKRGVRHA
ncbi:MAG: hypothetical protein NZ742_10510 [Acidobacteria bacterium]|nr:hypothetical protein [Acidobacteriota bacterium]MDW7985164.1 hypothetical protein [Acidobacteriota bacterium]